MIRDYIYKFKILMYIPKKLIEKYLIKSGDFKNIK